MTPRVHAGAWSIGAARVNHRTFTHETLRPMHASAAREAAMWGPTPRPGDWGYDPNGVRAEEYVVYDAEPTDEHAAPWTFWVWKERAQGSRVLHDGDAATDSWSDRPTVVRARSRPRPERIAGRGASAWPRRWARSKCAAAARPA
jgi:hypothetical protein